MPRMRTTDFDLTKLLSGPFYCTGCAERVCDAMLGAEGVESASCDLAGGTLTVTYDESALGASELEALVRRLGLEASERVKHAAYRLTGLD